MIGGMQVLQSEFLPENTVIKTSTGPFGVPGGLCFVMDPLAYTKFAALHGPKPRYVSNGRLGLIFHRSRKKAMRATGQGQCWVVSKTGKTLARRRSDGRGYFAEPVVGDREE